MEIVLVAGALVMAAGAALMMIPRRRSQPTHAIATADENAELRVRGTVFVKEPLVAPITRRPCVYYRVELINDGTAVHANATDFTLRDASGVAEVLVAHAHFEAVADIIEIGRMSDLSNASRDALHQLDFELSPIGAMTLREAVIELGATVDLVGRAVREPMPEASPDERGFRDPHATRLVFSSDVQVLAEDREQRFLGKRTD